MATLTPNALKALILQRISDNTTREVSPDDVRASLNDIIDSVFNRVTDQGSVGLRVHSTTKRYETGEAVIFDGQVFTSLEDANIGAFDPTKWELAVQNGGGTNEIAISDVTGLPEVLNEKVDFQLTNIFRLANYDADLGNYFIDSLSQNATPYEQAPFVMLVNFTFVNIAIQESETINLTIDNIAGNFELLSEDGQPLAPNRFHLANTTHFLLRNGSSYRIMGLRGDAIESQSNMVRFDDPNNYVHGTWENPITGAIELSNANGRGYLSGKSTVIWSGSENPEFIPLDGGVVQNVIGKIVEQGIYAIEITLLHDRFIVNIIGAQMIDVDPPTLISATIFNEEPTYLVLEFSEPVTETFAGLSLNNNSIIGIVSLNGSTMTLELNEAASFNSVLDLSYDASIGDITDTSSRNNPLASFTDVRVNNLIEQPATFSDYLYLSTLDRETFDTGIQLNENSSFVLTMRFRAENTTRLLRQLNSSGQSFLEIFNNGPSGTVYFIDGGSVSGASVFNNQWYTFAMSYRKDLSEVRFFIDGVSIGNRTVSSVFDTFGGLIINDLAAVRSENILIDYLRMHTGDFEDSEIPNLTSAQASINYDFEITSPAFVITDKTGSVSGEFNTIRAAHLAFVDENLMPQHPAESFKYSLLIPSGQSNSLAGSEGKPPNVEDFPSRVVQYGRGEIDRQIVEATIPLRSRSYPANGGIGPAYQFVNRYVETELQDNEQIIILHAGQGGTGFFGNHWGIGNEVYEDMVTRTLEIMALRANVQALAAPWSQGEADAGRFTPQVYQNLVADQWNDFRTRTGLNIPVLITQMVPAYANSSAANIEMDQNHMAIPSILTNSIFVSAEIPTEIIGASDGIHYPFFGQVELGDRCFEAYLALIQQ